VQDQYVDEFLAATEPNPVRMSDFALQFGALTGKRLRELLARTYAGGSEHMEVTVGLLIGPHAAAATMNGVGHTLLCPTDTRHSLGCVAKVLTGMLALQAACEGALDFQQDLAALGSCWSALEGINVRELLSHSHGIDVSGTDGPPLTPDEYIDTDKLCSLALDGRLFEPGALYSYSNAGSWFTAALLERAYGVPFAELLSQKLLRPAGVDLTRHDSSAAWCPAAGGGLSLSVPELLKVLRWFITQDDLCRHEELRAHSRPPGWCLERGACAGWKYYGSGWYGHNMVWEAHSLVVRVQPEDAVAVVSAAVDASASMTLARMIGHLLPEYAAVSLPKLLPGIPGADASACSGTYANRTLSVQVELDSRTGLEARIVPSRAAPDSSVSAVRTRLRPGTDRAFLAEPHAAPYFQWVQFISPRPDGYAHLWDGKSLLRRT